ncbi:MAG: signal recognition particle protein, partial [Pseudomonadota bacterium]
MFDTLSERLGGVFDRLRGRGALTEEDVNEALREVRVALIEADVALPVARSFVKKVKERAVGREVLKSVTPGQQVVKIVNDVLAETLGAGANDNELNLNRPAPVPILMVGLQGSGKTTSTAKIALRLQKRENKKVLMASLDTRRPAAMEQLQILGEQAGVKTLPIVKGQSAVQIAQRAIEAGRLQGFDIVMLDTAGRLSIDEQLMAEVGEIHKKTDPAETLLVLDALTGQDAVQTAERFKERVPVTGVVLTRLDGDGRGGAALSMREVTGAPIKFAGVGEKIDALDAFDPERMAGRILGMGDIVGLVEKAATEIDQEKAEKAAKKMAKGQFDLDDLADQFVQMRKMGGMGAIMGMMPG